MYLLILIFVWANLYQTKPEMKSHNNTFWTRAITQEFTMGYWQFSKGTEYDNTSCAQYLFKSNTNCISCSQEYVNIPTDGQPTVSDHKCSPLVTTQVKKHQQKIYSHSNSVPFRSVSLSLLSTTLLKETTYTLTPINQTTFF